MKFVGNLDYEHHDLFSDVGEWLSNYGISDVIDFPVDGLTDAQHQEEIKQLELRLGFGNLDRVWVEQISDGHSRLLPYRYFDYSLSIFALPNRDPRIRAIWVSQRECPKTLPEHELFYLGPRTFGYFLCEFCEDDEDSTDCEVCGGNPNTWVDVRSKDWAEDIQEVASDMEVDLPDYWWRTQPIE